MSTSGNDYNTNQPGAFTYDAYDDVGYDVQVTAVPQGQRGPFGEQYRILEDFMSDRLFLRAPAGLILPGCLAASAHKRERMKSEEADRYKSAVGEQGASTTAAKPVEVAKPDGTNAGYVQYTHDVRFYSEVERWYTADDWVSKVQFRPFVSLLLWKNDTWLTWLGVWFGFVGAALLPAVGTCVVLAFGAMPGR